MNLFNLIIYYYLYTKLFGFLISYTILVSRCMLAALVTSKIKERLEILCVTFMCYYLDIIKLHNVIK